MVIGILPSDLPTYVKLNIHSNWVLLERAYIKEERVKYKIKFDFRGFMITQDYRNGFFVAKDWSLT